MIYKHKSESKVASCITDVAYIITESESGLGEEKIYSIERIEGFTTEEWNEGSVDDWLNMYEPLLGMVEAANELSGLEEI